MKIIAKDLAIIIKKSSEIIEILEADHTIVNQKKLGTINSFYEMITKSFKTDISNIIESNEDFETLKKETEIIMIEDIITSKVNHYIKKHSIKNISESTIQELESQLSFPTKDAYRNFFKIIKKNSFINNFNEKLCKTYIKKLTPTLQESLGDSIDSQSIPYVYTYIKKHIQIDHLGHTDLESFLESYNSELNTEITTAYDEIILQHQKKEERKKKEREKNSPQSKEINNEKLSTPINPPTKINSSEQTPEDNDFNIYLDNLIEQLVAINKTHKINHELKKWTKRRFQQAYKNKKNAPVDELEKKFGVTLSADLQSLVSEWYNLWYFIDDQSEDIKKSDFLEDQQNEKQDETPSTTHHNNHLNHQKINFKQIVELLSKDFRFEDLKKFEESFEKLIVYTNESHLKINKLYYQITSGKWESRWNWIFVLNIDAAWAAHRLVRKWKEIIRIMEHKEYERFLNT